jgi:hypothetical protein
LKKYNTKATIAVDNHSTIVVNIKSGPLDIIGNWYSKATERSNTDRYGDTIIQPTYIQVNEYWISESYTGTVKDFLLELLDAMKGDEYFCHDDSQTDYFHRSHYTTINVGKWDKDYILQG